MNAFAPLITLEELRKYLRYYTLSENNPDKREFALDLLIKLEKGIGETPIPEQKSFLDDL